MVYRPWEFAPPEIRLQQAQQRAQQVEERERQRAFEQFAQQQAEQTTFGIKNEDWAGLGERIGNTLRLAGPGALIGGVSDLAQGRTPPNMLELLSNSLLKDLDRPRGAVAGLITDVQQGNFSGLGMDSRTVQGFLKPEQFTGSGLVSEAQRRSGMSEEEVARPMVDIGPVKLTGADLTGGILDLISDPTNYVGVGAGTKATGVVSKVGGRLDEAADAVRLASKFGGETGLTAKAKALVEPSSIMPKIAGAAEKEVRTPADYLKTRTGSRLPEKIDDPLRWHELFRKNLLDRGYGFRKQQERVGEAAEDVSWMLDMNINTMTAARLQRVFGELARVVGDDTEALAEGIGLSRILTDESLLAKFPGKRVDINPLEIAELRAGFETLSPETQEKAMRVAHIIQRTFDETVTRAVEEGLLPYDLVTIWRQQMPYYQPTVYLDAVGSATRNSGRKIVFNPVRRIGDTGAQGKVLNPLENMVEFVQIMDRAIHFNNLMRGIAKNSEMDPLTRIKKVSPKPSKADDAVREGVEVLDDMADEAISDNIQALADMNFSKFTNAPVKDRPNVIGHMDYDGRLHLYEVDPWVIKHLKDIARAAPSANHIVVQSVLQTNNVLKKGAIQLNPIFGPTQFIGADLLMNLVTNGPESTARAFPKLVEALRDIDNSQIQQVVRLAGGQQGRLYADVATATPAQQMIADYLPQAIKGKIVTPEKSQNKIIQALERVDQRFEQANLVTPTQARKKVEKSLERWQQAYESAHRMAAAEVYLDKTLPNWRSLPPEIVAQTEQGKEAARRHLEATINFARSGVWGQQIDQFVPFFNAALQAGDRLVQAASKSPKARWTLGTLMGVQAALTAWNLTFPDYLDKPDRERWGGGLIMLPVVEGYDDLGRPQHKYIRLIPNTQTFGVLFGPLTYAMEHMAALAPDEFWQWMGGMMGRPELRRPPQPSGPEHLVSHVLTMATPFGTDSVFNAAGPIGRQVVEQLANYDSFRDRPIVGPDLEGLPPSQQFTPRTSRTAQGIGGLLGISPVRIDHAVRGVLASAGTHTLAMMDFLLNFVDPREVDPEILELVEQYRNTHDPAERRAFMTNLPGETREAVQQELRQPEPQVPIVTPLVRRFNPGNSGQIERTAEARAAQEMGVNLDQSRRAMQVLSEFRDRQLDEQKKFDAKYEAERKIDPQKAARDWREGQRRQSQQLQGALSALRIQMPAANMALDPEAQKKYVEAIQRYAAGTAKTRGEILAAGYRAIPMEQADPDDPLSLDFESFFALRSAYKEALSPEDRAELERYLEANSTPLEQQYRKDQETLRPYWEIKTAEYRRLGIPALLEQLKADPGNITLKMRLESRIQEADANVRQKRMELRLLKPDVDAAGLRWGYWKTPITQSGGGSGKSVISRFAVRSFRTPSSRRTY